MPDPSASPQLYKQTVADRTRQHVIDNLLPVASLSNFLLHVFNAGGKLVLGGLTGGNDCGALLGEDFGDSSANTAACAGNDGNFS
jgi:hypothetical protein